jgi:hypothetical protein
VDISAKRARCGLGSDTMCILVKMEKGSFFRTMLDIYIYIYIYIYKSKGTGRRRALSGAALDRIWEVRKHPCFFFPPCRCTSTSLRGVVLRCIAAHLG